MSEDACKTPILIDKLFVLNYVILRVLRDKIFEDHEGVLRSFGTNTGLKTTSRLGVKEICDTGHDACYSSGL